ncbi:MAG: hypothetical protein ACI8TX_002112 [Hyphomicrobiaceae bacterium]
MRLGCTGEHRIISVPMPESTDKQSLWIDLVPSMAWTVVRPGGHADAEIGISMEAILAQAGVAAFASQAHSAAHPLTVVLNDAHRMTDSAGFLDALFGVLDREVVSGLPPIRALIAAGSHRADPTERRAHEQAVFGAHRDRFSEIRWHDAFDADGLVDVGASRLNRWMGEGGYYLACGSMEPHYFAGVTGAHKTLTVGVMDVETIRKNHEHAMSDAAAPLRLDGNPVHLGIVDALADLEDSGAHVFAFNQILVEGKLVAATAGHPLESLARGLDAVRSYFGAPCDAPYDVVVARVQAPLDRDFYQAEKGIKNTENVVRDGGTVVLDATCARGVGIDHFLELLRLAPTAAAARATVTERGYRLGDHKAVRLRALTDERQVRLLVVSPGLDTALAATLGAEIFPDRETAAIAVAALQQGGRALLVEDAGNLVPVANGSRRHP